MSHRRESLEDAPQTCLLYGPRTELFTSLTLNCNDIGFVYLGVIWSTGRLRSHVLLTLSRLQSARFYESGECFPHFHTHIAKCPQKGNLAGTDTVARFLQHRTLDRQTAPSMTNSASLRFHDNRSTSMMLEATGPSVPRVRLACATAQRRPRAIDCRPIGHPPQLRSILFFYTSAGLCHFCSRLLSVRVQQR